MKEKPEISALPFHQTKTAKTQIRVPILAVLAIVIPIMTINNTLYHKLSYISRYFCAEISHEKSVFMATLTNFAHLVVS